MEIEELFDCGDRVLSILTQRGRGTSSGAEVSVEFAQVVTLRAGKIIRIDNYLDRAEAFEAAGLSGQLLWTKSSTAALHGKQHSPRDTAWAMSEENVELARKAIDALNRGDLDAVLAFLSPDVVWEALEGVPGIGELYRGRAGVREWIELMWENAEEASTSRSSR